MQASKRLCQLFIVSRQAAKARCPRITALHHPALGQQHKPSFRLGQPDDFQGEMVGFGGLGRLRSCVPLVDIGDFDCIASDLLHFFSQPADLAPVLRIAAVTCKANRWPSVSTAICTFEPRQRLAPS